jgi:prevent-host-death family protein
MRKEASIAEAKAHLSELVSRAERQKRPTYITRRGVAVAAIVPLDLVPPTAPKQQLSSKDIADLYDGVGGLEAGAAEDLFRERR